MKNFSGVCQAAGADKPLRAFFIWITNIVTLLVFCFRFDGVHNLEYSPYDKDGKRDEKDHAKPIHRPMERLHE